MTLCTAKTYHVDVFTGDEKKAGTDANVFITLFGSHGQSEEFHLSDSLTHMNKFERNHVSIASYSS